MIMRRLDGRLCVCEKWWAGEGKKRRLSISNYYAVGIPEIGVDSFIHDYCTIIRFNFTEP